MAEEKFTTLGRLAGDPDFRAYCGFDIRGDVFTPTDSSENIMLRLSMVLDDFRSERGLTVTELKRKADRERYISELKTRMGGADESEAGPDDETDLDETAENASSSAASSTRDPGSVGPESEDDAQDDEQEADKPPPMKLFVGTSLNHCSLRLRNILHEVQLIPLTRYPNSAAALIRMVIELTVHEAHEVCSWPDPPQQRSNLRHWVTGAIKQLDPAMKAHRYLGLRQQINQRDSLVNTETLNAFLHSPTYLPSAPVMRSVSDTYSVLLSDLNRAIGEAKDGA